MGRKSKKIPLKKIIIIYCEGDSEKAYFEMLKRKYHSSNVHAEKIAINSMGLSGIQLLEKASNTAERLPKSKKADKIYVVFDRDNFTESDLIKCDKFAKENNINIIFSSVNLEIWILMHFRPIDRSYSKQQLNDILSDKGFFNTDYVQFKGKPYDDILYDRVKTAKENADMLETSYDNIWYKNDPFTNINRFLTEIFAVEEF